MDTNVNVTDARLATHKRRCAYEALHSLILVSY
jgi:hypothetical protein